MEWEPDIFAANAGSFAASSRTQNGQGSCGKRAELHRYSANINT